MKKESILKIAAGILFILLFAFGILLSQLKPLWNDELFSQVKGIEQLSYGQIVAGQIPEGNNSPLFYVLQKAVCDLTRFHLPFTWKHEWSIGEPHGQVILRIMPNFFMSLSLALIFYGLAVEYSWLAGVFAFFTALATNSVWMYWAEARPYALWFALTVVQLILFLRYVRHREDHPKVGGQLCVVHALLSLTVVFGSVQVFIVSLLLFGSYEKKFNRFLGILFLPLSLGLFYSFRSPHYLFGLPADPIALIFANSPPERFLFIIFCGILAAGIDHSGKNKKAILILFQVGILAVLYLGAALGIMLCFALTTVPGMPHFEISSRYFIFLAPVGIIGAAVFLWELLGVLRHHRWVLINVAILAAGLLMIRLLKVISEICISGTY